MDYHRLCNIHFMIHYINICTSVQEPRNKATLLHTIHTLQQCIHFSRQPHGSHCIHGMVETL